MPYGFLGTEPLRDTAVRAWSPPPGPWLGLGSGAAVLAVAGNIIGLAATDRVYGSAYPSLTNQAVAQDLTNLVVVAAVLLGTALLAAKGSVRAYLGWLGALLFTVYNYTIYCFSVHFGVLFPLWVAVLGLSVYALLGSLHSVDPDAVASRTDAAPRRLAAWFLIVIAALFAVLWLADIVRALGVGTVPASVSELGVPTNAVHVLDLAVFLPAAALAGVALLRQKSGGSVLAPALLLFLALTGVPILATPVVITVRGEPADWSVTAPIAVITIASLLLYLRTTAHRRGSR